MQIMIEWTMSKKLGYKQDDNFKTMITGCTTSESEPYHLPGSSVNPKTRSCETQ